jgi:hypothetical protein
MATIPSIHSSCRSRGFVPNPTSYLSVFSEAESKEKHGVWDPMPELTTTSPYVHSRVDSNTFTLDNPICQSRPLPCTIVDFIPQSGTLDFASGESSNFTMAAQALYAAQATSVINLELAPARFLFQKV